MPAPPPPWAIPSVVHDLLCPSTTATGPCTSGAEAVPRVVPTSANTPGANLTAQLNYLQANPSSAYTEVGPFSGVAGVFLQFTKEAGLHYDVSIVAVSSATLTGYLNNTGSEAGDLPLIANAKWNQVVMQDQSFRPLPTTVTVNGVSVPTRGNPAGFQSGANGLINAIDAADAAAGKANAAITLEQTQPLASYGYTSSNPNAPIFGSSTVAQNGGNPAFAPYVGAPNPIAQMAGDLHNAYSNEATSYNSANPTKSHVGVAFSGDSWVSAINLGIAVQNPYLTTNSPKQVNLWDSDPLTACCTTPIGYHPSAYGAYLDALTLFYKITGMDPVLMAAEFNAEQSVVPVVGGECARHFGERRATAGDRRRRHRSLRRARVVVRAAGRHHLGRAPGQRRIAQGRSGPRDIAGPEHLHRRHHHHRRRARGEWLDRLVQPDDGGQRR